MNLIQRKNPERPSHEQAQLQGEEDMKALGIALILSLCYSAWITGIELRHRYDMLQMRAGNTPCQQVCKDIHDHGAGGQ